MAISINRQWLSSCQHNKFVAEEHRQLYHLFKSKIVYMSILIPKRTEKTSKFKIMESIMLLCLLFVTSCSDNELEPTITTVEKVAFTAESGLQQTISITSSDAWKDRKSVV